MRQSAKLSSKNQITIPTWAMKKLGIKTGSRVALRAEGERLILERMDIGIAPLRGSLREVYGDPDQYIEALRGEWEQ